MAFGQLILSQCHEVVLGGLLGRPDSILLEALTLAFSNSWNRFSISGSSPAVFSFANSSSFDLVLENATVC